MKNLFLAFTAVAFLFACSGLVRANEGGTTKTEQTSESKAGGTKTTKSVKKEKNADGTGSTETKTETKKDTTTR